MVVAVAEAKLLILQVDVPAHGLGHPEIKGRAVYGGGGAVGEDAFPDLQIARGVEPEDLLHGLAAAGEVEVAVVRGGVKGILIAHGLIVDAEIRATLGEGIGHGEAEIAGEALLPVGREAGELHGIVPHDLGVPHHVVIALEAAVQAGLAVILIQLVFPAVEGEAGPGNAVADTPDHPAEMAAPCLVFRGGIVAQDHVGDAAVLIGHADCLDIGAVVEHGAACAAGIGDGIGFCLFSGGDFTEGTYCNRHGVPPKIFVAWIVSQTRKKENAFRCVLTNIHILFIVRTTKRIRRARAWRLWLSARYLWT